MTELLIPFAAPLADAGRAALQTLELPNLAALLARLAPDGRDTASEWSLSPPHERALAAAIGMAGADGCLPWAAIAAEADGVDTGDLAWGLVTPAHWHVGTDQISLVDPAELALDGVESRAYFEAVLPLVTGAGWLLRWGAPRRWYAAHESLAALPCASLDRVIGRNVDRWLGSDPALRAVRRLQSEVQMLLYEHPLNAAREARGQMSMNTVWLSGCGVGQAVSDTAPTVDDTLRAPALAADWSAWAQAWRLLDSGALARLREVARGGDSVRLTLAGERASAAWASAGAGVGWLARLRGAWSPPDPRAVLAAL